VCVCASRRSTCTHSYSEIALIFHRLRPLQLRDSDEEITHRESKSTDCRAEILSLKGSCRQLEPRPKSRAPEQSSRGVCVCVQRSPAAACVCVCSAQSSRGVCVCVQRSPAAPCVLSAVQRRRVCVCSVQSSRGVCVCVVQSSGGVCV